MNVNNRITFGHSKQTTNHNPLINPTQQHQYQTNHNDSQTNGYYRQKTSLQLLTNKVQMVEQRITTKNIINKLSQVYESIFQLIFIKESIMSMLNQQKNKTSDFIRDIKKYVFQLQMKVQRTGMGRQSRISANSRQSKVLYVQDCSNNTNRSIILGYNTYNFPQENELQKINIQLQRKCEQLTKQNQQLKLQYHKSLSQYQQQINYLISSAQTPQVKNQTIFQQQIAYLKQCLEQSNMLLKTQQQKYKEKIKYLENQIMSLEDEYIKEKERVDREIKRYREKEKMYMFQETQIQRKNILLIQRQKALFERESMLKQERNAVQRRETKLSDFQHNQMRRQKHQKQMERNNLRSQYYGTMTSIPVTKHEPRNMIHTVIGTEREKSNSSRNPGLDINARLKEIEQQKRKLGFAAKSSRISQGYRRNTQNRSLSKEHQFSKALPHQNRKPMGNQNVNFKLNDMLSNLQKDLNDIK